MSYEREKDPRRNRVTLALHVSGEAKMPTRLFFRSAVLNNIDSYFLHTLLIPCTQLAEDSLACVIIRASDSMIFPPTCKGRIDNQKNLNPRTVLASADRPNFFCAGVRNCREMEISESKGTRAKADCSSSP